MFKDIKVFKDCINIASQYFYNGISMIPQKGDYIKINGMYSSCRVESVVYDYTNNTILISV